MFFFLPNTHLSVTILRTSCYLLFAALAAASDSDVFIDVAYALL